MWGLVMVLVGYGSNDYRLKVWQNVDWMICHSNCKHFYSRLLRAMHQFFEPEQEGVIVSPAITVHTLRKRGEIETP